MSIESKFKNWSGKHVVPRRTVCIPDALWTRLGLAAAARRTNRSAVLNALATEYCERVESLLREGERRRS